jgi:hypothetical protein
MADEPAPSRLARVAATVGFALAGMTLAAFAAPALRRDALLRDGVRATATVVALEDTTCHYANGRRRTPFPCVKVTGEWTHEALTYRAVIGHHPKPHDFVRGRGVGVTFVPDPAAAAGRADVRLRVMGTDGSDPVSERPFYVGMLALSAVMCFPFLRMLLQALRARARAPDGTG